MRLPRVRFTVRRMMIAVVVVSLLIWSGKLIVLSIVYHRRSNSYRWMIAKYMNWGPKERWVIHPPSEHDRWARSMADKYERAARYPWLVLPPDPPEPK